MKFLSFEAEGVETYDECRKGRKIRKIRTVYVCIKWEIAYLLDLFDGEWINSTARDLFYIL